MHEIGKAEVKISYVKWGLNRAHLQRAKAPWSYLEWENMKWINTENFCFTSNWTDTWTAHWCVEQSWNRCIIVVQLTNIRDTIVATEDISGTNYEAAASCDAEI